MRIIGFNLTKILVQKQEKSEERLQISQNINIKDITEEKIPITENKALKISFNLIVEYSNNYAKIEFDGTILVLAEKDELKKILESWKSKKIIEQIRVPLFNFIMDRCNIKALQLEDELGLPFHVPMPKLTLQQKK
ncbi:MAG: hypothetical protein AABX77_02435 [Nanoarchaeota archaeon]